MTRFRYYAEEVRRAAEFLRETTRWPPSARDLMDDVRYLAYGIDSVAECARVEGAP